MTDKQKQFLELAVLQQVKYPEISQILQVDRVTLGKWWDELKSEREKLSGTRRIWKLKCKTANFSDFKSWYESAQRKCFYCGIDENEIQLLLNTNKVNTKRIKTRGKKLEIERLLPNEEYDKFENLVFCCYWCNNAKSDEFSAEEFKPIGKILGEIWKNRLGETKGEGKPKEAAIV